MCKIVRRAWKECLSSSLFFSTHLIPALDYQSPEKVCGRDLNTTRHLKHGELSSPSFKTFEEITVFARALKGIQILPFAKYLATGVEPLFNHKKYVYVTHNRQPNQYLVANTYAPYINSNVFFFIFNEKTVRDLCFHSTFQLLSSFMLFKLIRSINELMCDLGGKKCFFQQEILCSPFFMWNHM